MVSSKSKQILIMGLDFARTDHCAERSNWFASNDLTSFKFRKIPCQFLRGFFLLKSAFKNHREFTMHCIKNQIWCKHVIGNSRTLVKIHYCYGRIWNGLGFRVEIGAKCHLIWKEITLKLVHLYPTKLKVWFLIPHKKRFPLNLSSSRPGP